MRKVEPAISVGLVKTTATPLSETQSILINLLKVAVGCNTQAKIESVYDRGKCSSLCRHSGPEKRTSSPMA